MNTGHSLRLRNGLILAIIVGFWVALDQWSKAQFASVSPGALVAGPFAGIFELRLVHNTGAAWGMMSGATQLLGVFALVVCAALVIYVIGYQRRASLGEVIGAALVCAGGVGNAIDRFSLDYVVDFIKPVFIEFPVFNIADIGVTCGMVIFLVAFVVAGHHETELPAEEAAETLPSDSDKKDAE